MRNGVWIGKDIELVVTNKYEIIFRKLRNKEIIEIMLFRKTLQNNKISVECFGICQSDIIENSSNEPIRYKYAVKQISDDLEINIIQNDDNLLNMLNKHLYSHTYTKNEELSISFYDGECYELIKDEDILVCDEYLAHNANEAKVKECLVEWLLGTTEEWIDKKLQIISINTSKHMYIFAVTEEFIYCRAATYATCDLGVVFKQNIRVSSITNECHIIKDNRKARQSVEINESVFNPNACAFGVDGIYWTVTKVEDNLITLCGCGGDEYQWKRVDKDRCEWFKVN